MNVFSTPAMPAQVKAGKPLYAEQLFVCNALLGGFVGAFAVFPINVIVGRKQRDKVSTNVLKIVREEGVQGVYKGFLPRGMIISIYIMIWQVAYLICIAGIATAFEKTLKVQVQISFPPGI